MYTDQNIIVYYIVHSSLMVRQSDRQLAFTTFISLCFTCSSYISKSMYTFVYIFVCKETGDLQLTNNPLVMSGTLEMIDTCTQSKVGAKVLEPGISSEVQLKGVGWFNLSWSNRFSLVVSTTLVWTDMFV